MNSLTVMQRASTQMSSRVCVPHHSRSRVSFTSCRLYSGMANPRRHPTILEHSIFRKIKRNWGENGAAHRGKQSAISIYFQLFELLFGGVGFLVKRNICKTKQMPMTYFVSRLDRAAGYPKPVRSPWSVSPPNVQPTTSRPSVSPTLSEAKAKLRTPPRGMRACATPSPSPLPVSVFTTDEKGRRRLLRIRLRSWRRPSASPSPSPDPMPVPIIVRNKHSGLLEVIRPFPLLQPEYWPLVNRSRCEPKPLVKIPRWCL